MFLYDYLKQEVSFKLIAGVGLELSELTPDDPHFIEVKVDLDKNLKIYLVDLFFSEDTNEETIDSFVYDYIIGLRYRHSLIVNKIKNNEGFIEYEMATFTEENEGFFCVISIKYK